MTTKQILIASAELLGWTYDGQQITNPYGVPVHPDAIWPPRWLSDPTTDLNAAQELYLTLGPAKREDAVRLLYNGLTGAWSPSGEAQLDAIAVASMLLAATPEQLTEAVLRAAGKWEPNQD